MERPTISLCLLVPAGKANIFIWRFHPMRESFVTLSPSVDLITVSQGLTGKMTGIPAVTSSSTCNLHCRRLSALQGSVCAHCYTQKYLQSRPSIQDCYEHNSKLLSNGLILYKHLPFINATLCRLESFGDIINVTHLENYIRLVKKNNHCLFALFSKRYDLLSYYFGRNKQPKNLSIVLSSVLLNEPMKPVEHIQNQKIFTVYTKEFVNEHNVLITCGKRRCIDCRLCYQKNNSPIFITELLK